MNLIAKKLNKKIKNSNPNILNMLSDLGLNLFFPKGILTQTAEAKKYAKKYDATIGIAKEKNKAMYLPSLMKYFNNLDINEITPYAPSYGQEELRKLWREHIYEKNTDLSKDTQISLPVVTNGITHGLSIVADLFTNRGDTVLMPDKIWGNYRLTFITRCSAEFRHFPFFNKNNGFNLEDFENEIKSVKSQKNKLIVLLNFPNNPIGYSPTVSEANKIAEILLKYADKNFNIIAVIDDAYFGLFFEDNVFKSSVFSLIAGKHENLLAIKLDAATKEDYVWGFCCGFITYSTKNIGGADDALNDLFEALEKKTAGCVRSVISNCSNPAQSIMTKLLKDKDKYLLEKAEKYTILKRRAEKVKEVLKNKKYSDAWEMYPFNSGYFMCIKLKNINSEKYRLHLLHNYGVGVISPNDTDIRIAFSGVEEENIQELFDIMLDAYKTFKD